MACPRSHPVPELRRQIFQVLPVEGLFEVVVDLADGDEVEPVGTVEDLERDLLHPAGGELLDHEMHDVRFQLRTPERLESELQEAAVRESAEARHEARRTVRVVQRRYEPPHVVGRSRVLGCGVHALHCLPVRFPSTDPPWCTIPPGIEHDPFQLTPCVAEVAAI